MTLIKQAGFCVYLNFPPIFRSNFMSKTNLTKRRPVKNRDICFSFDSVAIFFAVLISVFILIIICGSFNVANNKNKLSFPAANSSFFLKTGEKSFDIKEYVIGSGEVFSNLAANLGLSDSEVQEIIKISENYYDLTLIKAGNKIKTFFDPKNNEFEKMIYDIDEDNYLLVEKTEQGMRAEKIKKNYEVELSRAFGIVKESLYLAGQEAGLEDKIIMEMTDIFAWDIDFGFDARAGDEFEVLYEKKYFDGEPVKSGKVLVAHYQNQGQDHWAFYFKDPDDREDYYDLDGNCLRRQFLKAPINYRYISSSYSSSRYHPLWHTYTSHLAIDYAAACGTPVSASGAGTVIFAGWKNNVYGRTIEVRHNEVYTTRYAHLSAYGKGIKYGAKVSQGQIIGFVGTTGTSTGCHLDYAMKKYGSFVNPLSQNFERSEPIKNVYQEDFEVRKQTLLKILSKKN